MNNFKHIGKDFIPHDVVAKVTGTAKYAEDFRADGMVFCRLLTSPMPHARVKHIDAADALKMEGVLGMLTADDIPAGPPGFAPSLTKEPMYVGEPILAVAALSEQAAEDAIAAIKIDYEPLPFTHDPLESLFPGGKDARGDGFNIGMLVGLPMGKLKWSAADFARVKAGEEMPMGKPAEEWNFGDVEARIQEVQGGVRGTLRHRLARASQHGAAQLHGVLAERQVLRACQAAEPVVLASGAGADAGHQTRRVGADRRVLRRRLRFQGRGLSLHGDPGLHVEEDRQAGDDAHQPRRGVLPRFGAQCLPGQPQSGLRRQRQVVSRRCLRGAGQRRAHQLLGLSPARRCAGAHLPAQCHALAWHTGVHQRADAHGAARPGQNQLACIMEPLVDRAARELKLDRVEIRKKNNPVNGALGGMGADGKRVPVPSAYLRDALDKGSAKFNWAERKKRSGQKNGPRVTGIGVGQAFHPAGFAGFDGLVCITPDGKLHIHTGVGNLGTFSHSGTSRIAAEVLKVDWDNCVIERGDSRKNLPWNIGQFGSNTSYTMTRTNYVAAQDALAKLKEIAAKDLGGKPEDYDVDGAKVFAKANPSKSLSYGDAAKRAIALGGKFDGHELPADINPMTKASATALAGTGLIGVAKDNLPWTGQPSAFAACFIEIELDTETGMHRIVDLVSVADCGTVIHPMGVQTQIKGGAVQGIGMATLERLVFDPQNGLPANVGLHQQKPASYLDLPPEMHTDVVDKPDPSNPVGAKGIGEPLMGASASALLCAISDAMGGHVFNRTPVLPDMIVNHFAGRPQPRKALTINTQ